MGQLVTRLLSLPFLVNPGTDRLALRINLSPGIRGGEICLVCAVPPSIRFPEVSASRATSNIVLSESSRLNSPPYDHPHNVWQWMTHHNATNAARIKDAFGGEVAKRLLHL